MDAFCARTGCSRCWELCQDPKPVPQPQAAIAVVDERGETIVDSASFQCDARTPFLQIDETKMNYDACKTRCASKGLTLPCLRSTALKNKFNYDMYDMGGFGPESGLQGPFSKVGRDPIATRSFDETRGSNATVDRRVRAGTRGSATSRAAGLFRRTRRPGPGKTPASLRTPRTGKTARRTGVTSSIPQGNLGGKIAFSSPTWATTRAQSVVGLLVAGRMKNAVPRSRASATTRARAPRRPN